MAFGSSHMIPGDYGNFIPEMWSDEVIGAYKSNLVVANLITKIPHVGKKGDTIHIPAPSRGSANAKVAETMVTLNNAADGVVNLSIDKHYEYSFIYEDILKLQALDSLRKFFTDDAGYALAKQIDQDLMLLSARAQGGSVAGATNLYESAVLGDDGSTNFSGSANTNTGNGAALTDAGLRKMIQTLDDADVPMMGRSLIVPPVEKNNILGIARYTEQAFNGDGSAMRTGMIANLYGVPVFVSTNCPWIHVNDQTGTQSVTFSSSAPTGASYSDAFGLTVDWNTSSPNDTKYRVGMLLHKDAWALVEQQAVRSQMQSKLEWLGDLFVADTVYGVGELRDGNCVPFVTPA